MLNGLKKSGGEVLLGMSTDSKSVKIYSELRTTISKGKKKHKRVISMIKSVTLVDTKNNPSSILLL